MPTAKVQHYVPKFYLKNFSSDGKINVYDKSQEAKFATNIKNIGCEGYFYSNNKDANHKIEKRFGKWESQFSIAYSNLIKNKNLKKLSEYYKTAITFFIATQYLRTKEFRERIRDQYKQVIFKLLEHNLSPNLQKEIDEVKYSDENYMRNVHIKMMDESLSIYVKAMRKMKWILMENNTNLFFWTSDNPVTLHNILDFSPFGNLGLLNNGIQFHFPLTPHLILVICDPITYKDLPEYLLSDNEQNVIFENFLQVHWSTRHILSIDNNFKLANKIIEKYPKLKEIDRKRVTVN